ncbi:leucyl/phenylalanyl-tRNA--protein transferase [Leptospira sp. GIMC2001]|uniref:leucyl/phenylalanyl-tRNA--protein transferase n=1 Tax=Leptospira sp. GIMC2001 TaxID=1513297 RepID=UPI00234C02EB|nr:leucyl/phenylalanyl-tRNA--protein transferase [Leptospira sp. GIMC2001]WCL48955.1 leucyl/phenylalanyl-tRNA--protein transferase [Leptospira sp. GIMC2001]
MTVRDFGSFFKDPRKWNRDIVAIGGDFSCDRLFYAYTHGIFPWSENPVRWYCLEPRAIFDLNRVHFSRTVHRKIRKNIYKISFNRSFEAVVRACSHRPNEETWITPGFIEGYTEFHRLGFAHSIEVWNDQMQLVGGAYGVAIGQFFAGESMFSFESDAGKIALYHLFNQLRQDGFELFDTQQLNHFTWELGAYEIPKHKYLDRLDAAVANPKKWIIEPGLSSIH